jgi:hypothetical protein
MMSDLNKHRAKAMGVRLRRQFISQYRALTQAEENLITEAVKSWEIKLNFDDARRRERANIHRLTLELHS